MGVDLLGGTGATSEGFRKTKNIKQFLEALFLLIPLCVATPSLAKTISATITYRPAEYVTKYSLRAGVCDVNGCSITYTCQGTASECPVGEDLCLMVAPTTTTYLSTNAVVDNNIIYGGVSCSDGYKIVGFAQSGVLSAGYACSSGVLSGGSCAFGSCPTGYGPVVGAPLIPGSWTCSNDLKNLGPAPCPACLQRQTEAGSNPINSATGNKYQRELDYKGTGAFPLRAERYYSSGVDSGAPISPWGSRWSGNYGRRLFRVVATALDPFWPPLNAHVSTAFGFERPDGRVTYISVRLVENEKGRCKIDYTNDSDVTGKFEATGYNDACAATGWTYRNDQDEVETYDASGKLQQITNKAGLTQTLTYDSVGNLIRVTDPAGRTLKFDYDGARVVKMTDPSERVYLYGYDISGNLSSVNYPDGKTKTYLYGEVANVSASPNAGVSYANALTGIVDENGDRYASWTYDAAGRATSSEHGAGGGGIDRVNFVYAEPYANGDSTTKVTDVRGVTRTYKFSTIFGVVKNTGITGQPCDGCYSVFTFDGGNLGSRSDFKGSKTCYAYDPMRNLEVVRLEGLPAGTSCPADLKAYIPSGDDTIRKITTRWNANYRLPETITEPLRITTYAYDNHGNVATETIQPTTDSTGGAGLSASTNGTARTTTYDYYTTTDARNTLLQTIDGPRTDVADVTTYGYAPATGDLLTVTNALNQVTTLGGYDANGKVGIITDPNGLITSFTYDPRGRLTSRSVGGETTGYSYDGAGNLASVTLPSGATYTYNYDAAHRLTQITDAQNNKLIYTLDAAGNRTKEELFDAADTVVQTRSRVFDGLNHLYQDIGAVNQITTYAYDANGNLTSITDPLNRQTTSAYDALNRLSQVTQADNSVIKYGYDGLGQLTQVIDPRGLATRYARDGLGNLGQTISPDTGTTAATYDAAGNLITRTDAKGQVASYSYDALNRISGITYSDGTNTQTVTYQYDQGPNGIGHLTRITDFTGTTTYSYNQNGHLKGETRQMGATTYTTAYSYDTRGRLTGITYPSGRTVNYSLDTQGRIASISTTLNSVTKVVASNIVYEPFGGVHGFTYGDGVAPPVQSYVRQRDQDGRIASYTLGGRAMSIGYDAASQIAFIMDPQNLAATANYSYDPMSRLSGFTQGAANQNYGYDLDGNRTSQTIGTTSTSYGYSTTSNRLNSIQSGAAAPQSVSHDANGATTTDATRQYAYDARGRLIQTTTAQGVINYEVNALGLRVRKQVPYASTDTLYHYDAQGHLIGENQIGDPRFTREYIYLGDLPVAVLQ